jgi:serine/threonine protein kinase
MTPGTDPNKTESLRLAIQSQHPGIAGELEGAINTLRKLQDIAGPTGAGAAVSDIGATTDSAAPDAPADHQTTEAPRPCPLLACNHTFGRYQIVRRLGQGAMGAVYLAYDGQLHRHVALKTPSLGSSPLAVERFFLEARAAAQLRSPYLCPVYDVGQIGAVHYLSMAFIDGRPLSRLIDERTLGDARAIAALTQKIARGMQKAHERGIIHRDLKPDNIMVDTEGDPIVMDFGLARRIDADAARLTSPGRLLGTPAFMSPEQVDCDPNALGPPTDIYSLGVVLYEMLTGKVPFQGSLTAILRQIVSTNPPRPSSINPALGDDSPLERICLKMMARCPADRYPSMAAVAEALEEAFFNKQPPTAGGPSLWKRLASWLAKLFMFRRAGSSTPPAPAAPPSAPTPQGSDSDRTEAGSNPVTPPKELTPQRSEQTIDLAQASSGTSNLPQMSDATSELPQLSSATSDLPQMSHATSDLPQMSHATSDLSQMSDATGDLAQLSSATSDLPQMSHATSDLPQSGH